MPCAEVERLVHQLANACEKELEDVPPVLYSGKIPEGYVTAGQRDQTVLYLLQLSEHFGFDPETFGYAVMCLDRFLSRVKAQTRYLQCISLASLLIAAKMSEEEEFIPKVSDFITVSRCSHTTADLRRMEIVMLQKIDWKVYCPTPVYFLQKFGELLVALGYFPKHLLTPLLKQCIPVLLQLMCQSTVMCHRGSVLALGVLNLELGNIDGIASHWIEEMAGFAVITDEEYIHCCGLINDYLDLKVMIYHKAPTKRRHRRRNKSAGNVVRILPTIWEDNQSEHVDEEMAFSTTDEDVDMYDGQMILEATTDSSNKKMTNLNEIKTQDRPMVLEDKNVRLTETQQAVNNSSSVGVYCHSNVEDNHETDVNNLSEDFHCCNDRMLHENNAEPTDSSGKPLYSTVVKMSCSKTLCSTHCILSSTSIPHQTLAY